MPTPSLPSSVEFRIRIAAGAEGPVYETFSVIHTSISLCAYPHAGSAKAFRKALVTSLDDEMDPNAALLFARHRGDIEECTSEKTETDEADESFL